MICLNNTDVLEAWSDTNAVIDYHIFGLVGTVWTRLASGVLGNAANVVVYTAGAATSIVAMSFTNIGGAAATVNLKLDPADGGNDKFLLAVAVSLEAGSSLAYDGSKFSVMNTAGRIIQSVAVSDAAYGAGWNGITDTAASKNAIYDQMELRAPKASPTFTGVVTAPTIDLTGGQIAFPAIAVPSADPNTIDDYEEGTWTPVVADAAVGGNVAALGTSTGFYTKIGRILIFNITLVNINTAGMTGGNTLYVRAFPFTSSGNHFCTTKVDQINFTDYVITNLVDGETHMTVIDNIDSANDAILTVAAVIGATSDIFITGTGAI